MRIGNLFLCGVYAVAISGATFAAMAAGDDAADRKKVTSQYYVDEKLKLKQPEMSGTSGQVVMYPTSIDQQTGFGTPGGKPVAEALSGSGVTDNDLPNVGAVRAGLEDKQDKLSGTNGYVVTYRNTTDTGTEQLKGNPIYNPSQLGSYEPSTGSYGKKNENGVLQANHANPAIARGLNGHLTPDTSNTGPGGVNWLYTINTETSGTEYTKNP